MSWSKLSKLMKSHRHRPQLSCEDSLASTVIVPLYIYPEPGAWNPLHTCIRKHTSIHFLVIVNPGNGPGPSAVPDANYVNEIPKLTTYANVDLLGYVHTSFTQRDQSAVIEDIRTYSKWAEQAQYPNLAINGIFVDETPNQFDVRAERFLRDLTSFAKSCDGFGGNKLVIHNPGCVPSPMYMTLADVTVVFEDTWSTFTARSKEGLFDLQRVFGCAIPDDEHNAKRAKLAVMIHSVPQDLKPDTVKAFIRDVKRKAGIVFITDLDVNYYSNWSRNWVEWTDRIATLS